MGQPHPTHPDLFEEVLGQEREELLEALQAPDANLHSRDMEVEKVWRVKRNHKLGQTGGSCKMRLWHGTTSFEAAKSIAENSFDLAYAKVGAFGKGLYFTPHVCKALNYTSHQGRSRMLFLCEVAVGLESNRMYCPPIYSDLTSALCYQKLLVENGCRCVHYFAQAPVNATLRTFEHDELVVFKGTQARPLFLFELGPGNGASSCDSTAASGCR